MGGSGFEVSARELARAEASTFLPATPPAIASAATGSACARIAWARLLVGHQSSTGT
jgi:hypothetical protein